MVGKLETVVASIILEHISKIIIDPKTTIQFMWPFQDLWSDSDQRGLYKSTDGGNTFSKILYIDNKVGCADIAVDPTNTNIVYATVWEFRRTPYSFNSGGKTQVSIKVWMAVRPGKINEWSSCQTYRTCSIIPAPSEPNHLLAIIGSKRRRDFISPMTVENHGKKQSVTFNVISRPFYFSTLVIDPKDSKRVLSPGPIHLVTVMMVDTVLQMVVPPVVAVSFGLHPDMPCFMD